MKGHRNPQRTGDRRTRFLANRVALLVSRILIRGIPSPLDPSVHVPRENLAHQEKQRIPGEAAEVVVSVPSIDERGRLKSTVDPWSAVPGFTLRIGYYDEPIAGRHRAVQYSGGDVEHTIYLNTKASEIDRRRTGWYDLATQWKALPPRLGHRQPTADEVYDLAAKVVGAMRSTLIHELTHLIDAHQGRIPAGPERSASRRKASEEAAAGGGRRYYNDPAETNAFFQQVSHAQVGIARVLFKSLRSGDVTLATAVKRFKTLWPSASAFVADTLKRMGQHTNLDMMSPGTRKHLVKRAAGLYESLRDGLRQAAKGKLRHASMLTNPPRQETQMSKQPFVEVDGILRPALNSEGRMIHPTPQGVINFWRWFGTSKVVDKQGRPLVMYHGTPKSFGAFRPSKVGMVGAGIYFTPHANDAGEYSIRSDIHSEGSCVLPVYLRMENPKVVKNSSEGVDWFWKAVNDYKGPDADEEMTRRSRSQGYDGVVVGDGKNGIREMMVFDPEQVKSVSGNRGTFTPSDPVLTNPRRRKRR